MSCHYFFTYVLHFYSSLAVGTGVPPGCLLVGVSPL
jgi:hypothetical protein